MLDPIRAKVALLAVTATAFTGGVLIASGLEWTTDSHAAQLQAPPSRQEVKPVADLSQAFISIAKSVTPSVVSIATERQSSGETADARGIPPEFRQMFPFFRGPQQQGPEHASGSGFFISPDGYIMTNNHVVEGASRIDVVLQDNRQFRAKLVGRDPTTDVAVIKIEGNGFPAVRFGDVDDAQVGEWVLAMGNPLDIGFTVTSGIISAKGRPLGIISQSLAEQGGESNTAIEDFIQTDAAINPGNSGGPLIDLNGNVIGVNSAIASRTGLYAGYGFAIPADLARRVADDLIRYGRSRRPVLGVFIQDVSPEDAEVYKLPSVSGVLVQGFPSENSSAQRAGVKQGDVIVGIDGRPVSRVSQLQRLIRVKQPGEMVTLDVIRGGDRKRVRVDLTENQPTARRTAANRTATPQDDTADRLGFNYAPLTPALAQRLGLDDASGVVVTDVVPYGPASRKIGPGLRITSADGQAITTAQQFQQLVRGKKDGEILRLVLQNSAGQESLANVRIGG
ncbi:DegQ family serine endoprotease [soil metagenome]